MAWRFLWHGELSLLSPTMPGLHAMPAYMLLLLCSWHGSACNLQVTPCDTAPFPSPSYLPYLPMPLPPPCSFTPFYLPLLPSLPSLPSATPCHPHLPTCHHTTPPLSLPAYLYNSPLPTCHHLPPHAYFLLPTPTSSSLTCHLHACPSLPFSLLVGTCAFLCVPIVLPSLPSLFPPFYAPATHASHTLPFLYSHLDTRTGPG